jgi:c-di-GMP-binding flagellar brake protein YcgR
MHDLSHREPETSGEPPGRPAERRHAARVSFRTYMNQIVNDEPYLCRGVNISHQGVYVTMPSARRAEPEGHNVLLQFMLPGHADVLWACGRVVRSDTTYAERGAAVEFTYLTDSARQAIRRFVDKRQVR